MCGVVTSKMLNIQESYLSFTYHRVFKARNLIWTFKSISEIARYDSEIARKSLAGSTQMGSG
jgi:hypothetical protein